MFKQFNADDLIFTRLQYQKGTQLYQEYYQKNPHLKEIDDQLRGGEQKKKQGDKHLVEALIKGIFALVKALKDLVPKKAFNNENDFSVKEMSSFIKNTTQYLGADLVGISEYSLGDCYLNYRDQFTTKKRQYAIVFALEMDRVLTQKAPSIFETLETSQKYVQAALIGAQLTYFLAELGYYAYNHCVGTYQMPLPFLAVKAGLGEIGRLGILLTEQFGPRVRLGAVTTDLELAVDGSKTFKLAAFCQQCLICAKKCLAQAISFDPPQLINNNLRWKTQGEKCYAMWQKLGTDCGVCLKVCPFS